MQTLGRLAVHRVADVPLVDLHHRDAVGQRLRRSSAGPYPPLPSAGMRVISGSARGRKLVAPEGSGTRPTPDRVREATFNALGSLGVVQEAAVLDLFAGSGAMGIEALSRGAARVTFVDRDRGRPARHRGEPGRLRARRAAEVVAMPGRAVPGRRGQRGAAISPCSTRPTTTTAGPSCSSTLPAQTVVLEAGRADRPAVRLGRRPRQAVRPHARGDRTAPGAPDQGVDERAKVQR